MQKGISMSCYQLIEKKQAVELLIRAAPNSSRNQIVGVVEGSLKIKLKAPPVDGEANEELVAFVSKWLKISKSEVLIQKGTASKNKKILVPLRDDIVEKIKIIEKGE